MALLGANIGTTITAIIVGFDLFQYASFFLIIGAFCLLFSNHPKIKGLAQILFGLGCLFYGLELMSMHLEAITKLPEFMKLVTLFTNHPILAMFGGAITTALIQSSSAMIAIVQQMYHLKAISFMFYSLYLWLYPVQPLPLFFLPLKPIHLPKKPPSFIFSSM